MAQREIKFRAWLNEPDLMVFSNGQASTEECEIWVFAEGGLKIQIQQTTWKEGGGETFERIEYVDCDAKIMQFTGLHDKNGKEVFDGDILANSHRDDDDNIYVCEYDNSQASFVFTSPFDGESLEQNDFVSDLVIIGNRYENEELLK